MLSLHKSGCTYTKSLVISEIKKSKKMVLTSRIGFKTSGLSGYAFVAFLPFGNM